MTASLLSRRSASRALPQRKWSTSYRRVYQNQDSILCRRRGTTLRPDWLPPSLARRLALSRSMSAFRPSCNNVERSRGPVNLMALAIRPSSNVTVVRISFLRARASTLAPVDAQVDSKALLVRDQHSRQPAVKTQVPTVFRILGRDVGCFFLCSVAQQWHRHLPPGAKGAEEAATACQTHLSAPLQGGGPRTR